MYGSGEASGKIKVTLQIQIGSTLTNIRVKSAAKIKKEMKKQKTNRLKIQLDGIHVEIHDMAASTEKVPSFETFSQFANVFGIMSVERFCIIVCNIDQALLMSHISKTGKISIDQFGVGIIVRQKGMTGGGEIEDKELDRLTSMIDSIQAHIIRKIESVTSDDDITSFIEIGKSTLTITMHGDPEILVEKVKSLGPGVHCEFQKNEVDFVIQGELTIEDKTDDSVTVKIDVQTIEKKNYEYSLIPKSLKHYLAE
jgi:hypothetical protein